MEKAATDIYTFENLRKRGYSYIDKTAIPRRRKSRAADRSRRVRATARAPSALPTSRGRPSTTSASAWC